MPSNLAMICSVRCVVVWNLIEFRSNWCYQHCQNASPIAFKPFMPASALRKCIVHPNFFFQVVIKSSNFYTFPFGKTWTFKGANSSLYFFDMAVQPCKQYSGVHSSTLEPLDVLNDIFLMPALGYDSQKNTADQKSLIKFCFFFFFTFSYQFWTLYFFLLSPSL